jgi:hypothetical protein
VDEQHRARAGEAPRRLLRPGEGLPAPREEPALAVKEEKSHDADERRQYDRQCDQRPERAPTGEVGALEEKRERNPDRGRERHRRERDPEARPQRLPLIGTPEELRKVLEAPSRRRERLPQSQHQRITHEPDKQNREQPSRNYPLSPRKRVGVRG